MLKTRLLLVLSLWLAFACQSSRSGDEPIARVNGLVISLRDYINLYETMKPRDIELAGRERQEMRNLIIQTLVRRAVILTKADQMNIQVEEKELREGVEKFKQGYPEQVFREALFEGMVDEAEWVEQVRQNLLIEKMFEASRKEIASPTLEEAMQYYQDNPQEFVTKASATALHIVVGERELAEEIREQLVKEPHRFRELARLHSMGPEAQEDARIQVEKNTLPEEIDTRLFDGPLRSLSPVIESPYGYHLFYVLSRNASMNLDFQQVREEIVSRIQEDRRRLWIEMLEEELIRASEIEYNRKLIRSL